jgi:hypothetical protein
MDFSTPTEGFELLRELYMDSEVTGGEFLDSLDFSGVSYGVAAEAVELFREWDEE